MAKRAKIETKVIGDLPPVGPLPEWAKHDPYEIAARPKPPYKIDFLSAHTVYKNAKGHRVPSVTTVLKMLNKPQLLHWAWKLGHEGKELEATRQHAADIGTIAHALCEAYLSGRELDRSNLAPEMLEQAEHGFQRFLAWWEKEHLAVIETEYQMVSESLQVGGTADVIASHPNGRTVLADFKTSPRVYDESFIQAATYAAIYEERIGPIDDVFIVRIGKEQDDPGEIVPVRDRLKRSEAFALLARARTALQTAGMKL